LSRHALEVLAADGYRQEALTQLQVGKLPGLSRVETQKFLPRHVDICTTQASCIAKPRLFGNLLRVLPALVIVSNTSSQHYLIPEVFEKVLLRF
jgi:hypothetical protein